MKIIISPAKSLNFENQAPTNVFTKPVFTKQSKEVHKVLKTLKPTDLSSLMDISDNLAHLNWQRNKTRKYQLKELNAQVKQAVFAFNGDVYTGLDANSLNESQILYLQNKLNILSGLYGLLKPLDAIEPYRLEMGIKLSINEKKDLYDFWNEHVTLQLNKGVKKNDVLINLASNEYFGAVNKKLLKAKIITPEFKEYKNGQLKMISFFAKKARGLMVRFMAENGIENVEDIKNFNVEGYLFDSNLSTDTKWVFTR
ncbi:peroxide stress protein YaaA [Myroides sp. JBRI-B21084]|uniref:peroxide stress protein YaaA n=1 Tax=Myroides sp. JBRI-B21084 TaxID=3119977 RepID=UPI0026E2471D|nr:peroxide stress protein YaaA [Paenimyroides cloacae]WKW46771.1 peroxide stress protein YaaA [Paenimyroides cloacae]